MNAVLLASGLAQGSRDAARDGFDRFWRKVSDAGRQSLFSCDDVVSAVTRTLSPYQLNPLGLNPLRAILAEELDVEAVRARAAVRPLIGATRVRDGILRIFRNKDISEDVLLASACLPHLHHAVSIDGEPHWDGGYAANPPLMPLVHATRACDVLVVQIIPANDLDLPSTSPAIDRRLGQITFNGSLQKDIEALSTMMELCRQADVQTTALGRKLRRLKLHHISADTFVDGLSHHSFKNTDWDFLIHLREQGRAAADTWLREALPEPEVAAPADGRCSAH
jgi:NTE family protein